MIADSWSDLPAAEPMSARREPRVHGSPGHEPGDQNLLEKTGRSIRCPARNLPAKEPEPVSSPMDKRTGASPSCRECLTTPAFRCFPSVLPMRCECGRLPSGALRTPFIQQRIIIARFRPSVRKCHGKFFLLHRSDPGTAADAYRVAGALERAGVGISMDGRGRFLDNIFIERLWRSLKHEDICLKHYSDGRKARAGIASWIAFHNSRRPHQGSATRPNERLAPGDNRRPPRHSCGHDASLGKRSPRRD